MHWREEKKLHLVETKKQERERDKIDILKFLRNGKKMILNDKKWSRIVLELFCFSYASAVLL